MLKHVLQPKAGIIHLQKPKAEAIDLPADGIARRLVECGAESLPILIREDFHYKVVSRNFIAQVFGGSSQATLANTSAEKKAQIGHHYEVCSNSSTSFVVADFGFM